MNNKRFYVFSGPATDADRSCGPRADNGRRCVLIGASPDIRGFEMIEPDDFVAVCDGGLGYAISHGIGFDLVVGDFDSYSGDIPPLTAETVKLPSEKDDTDTGYAASMLIGRGYMDFLLLGAAGGRFDHALGNLSVGAAIAENGGTCVICGRDPGEMIFIFRNRSLSLEPAEGAYVSVFPLGCASVKVTLEGFKYPLSHATLRAGATLGVSNEFAAFSVRSGGRPHGPGEHGVITAESGTVMAVTAFYR